MQLKTILGLVSVGLGALALLSCVDLGTPPEFPDFHSQTRFINAETSQASVLLEPTVGAGLSSFATIDPQGDTGYRDVPAGDRLVKLAADPDTTLLAVNADAKLTVVIFPRAAAADPRFRGFQERRTFDSVPADTAQVRFIAAALSAASYDIVNTSDTTVVASGLALRGSSGYVSLPPGNYTFGVVEAGSTTILATAPAVTLADGKRSTVVVFGTAASLALKNFQDD
jgi:hypothetical protein